MRIYPEHVISSHVPYGHFGSIPLTYTCKNMLTSSNTVFCKNKTTIHQKTHFWKMLLLVGKWFPHPVWVFCTHLEPPKCHIRPKSIFCNIPFLLYFYPIDPFKGLPIGDPYWPKLGGDSSKQSNLLGCFCKAVCASKQVKFLVSSCSSEAEEYSPLVY